MAYTTKYRLPFTSPYASGNVYLKKIDYVGGITILRMPSDGLEIESIFEDWFSPILRQKATITFINTAVDFFEYSDLFELEERDFQVVIEINKDSGVIIAFDGWLNSETIQQKYLHNSTVILTATNYVSKLEYHFDDAIDILDERSLIDFISQALVGTEKEDTLALNCHLFPTGYEVNSSTRSGFVKGAINTEIFWENNIERKDSLEVLTTILKAFDCYLYWWDGKWWIERYREIYQASIDYYPYDINPSASYGYDDAVTQETRVNEIIDIKDLYLTDESQTLFSIPGYNRLEIFLNQKYFLNLVFNDFSEATVYDSGGFAPLLREWEYFEGNQYVLKALPFMNIGNSILRLASTRETGGTGKEFYEYQEGIGTKFRMTVATNTNLSIQWKSNYYCGSVGFNACSDPSNVILIYNYWIRIVGTDEYLFYDTTINEWVILETTLEKEAVNEITVSGSAAYKDYIYKSFPKVTIPLTEIDTKITDSGDTSVALLGDYDFEIMIGVTLSQSAETGQYNAPFTEYLGDVVVTADNEPQNNLIKGELDNNVLKSRREEFDLFDSLNWNYVNAVLTSAGYNIRTETWVEDENSASPDYSLAQWNLVSKFQLLNRNRKRIKSNIRTSLIFKPFDLFIDGNDGDRKYVLGTYRWNVIQGKWDAQFEEYDNEETINLV